MPVNFSTTVLAAGQGAFGVAIMVNPVVSQPNADPYAARGIWKDEPVLVETRAGFVSTNQPSLSIRLEEFAVIPQKQDVININDPTLPASVAGIFWSVIDIKPDGMGKAELKLKSNLNVEF